jgi:TP901 family phage tail tape measure protein
MANESSVVVRLRLLGGQLFASTARRDAVALGAMGKSGGIAARAMRGVSGALGVASAAAVGAARLIRRAAFPLAALGVASGKLAMDFQQAMEMIHTQAGASQKEVDSLSKSVLNLAKIEPQSPKELANALYRLEGAGLRGRKAMTGLKAAADLAAVGNANVEDTAKTLSQTWFSGIKGAGNLRGVVAELNATVGAGDLRLQQLVDALGVGILPVAKNAGLTLRDITGVMAVFGDETNNVSGWTAQLATALHYLYAPTAKASDALHSIGLSGTQLGKDFRKRNGLLTAMRDLRGHLDKLPGGFRGLKAAQTLSKILPGGRGRVLNVLLGQLDRYTAKLHQVGATTSRFGDSVRKTQQTAAFKVKAAWSTIQVALIRLGSHVLPFGAGAFTKFAGVVDWASGKLERFGAGKGKRIAADLGRIGAAFRSGQQGSGQGFGGISGRVADVSRALPHIGSARAGLTAGLAGRSKAETAGFSGVGGVAVKVGGILRMLAKTATTAGKQLVEAFKPAMPFFQNILLPLLKGIAIGVIGSVVAAFKVLIPIIRITATVLGAIGKVAAPFRGVFTGIGVVIGFLAAGPILKLLGALGRVGVVFRLLAKPIEIANVVFRLAFRVVERGVLIFVRAHLAVARFVGTFVSAPARMARAALNIVGRVIHVVETLPGKLARVASSAGGKFARGLISATVNTIKAAPGAIAGAITSIVPGKLKSVVKKIIPGLATGGTVSRGGVAVVGERGPELMRLPTGSTVYDSRTSRRASAALADRPIVLTANLFMSGKQIHSEILRVDRQTVEAT